MKFTSSSSFYQNSTGWPVFWTKYYSQMDSTPPYFKHFWKLKPSFLCGIVAARSNLYLGSEQVNLEYPEGGSEADAQLRHTAW
jgi:hypothetical protein